MWDHNERIKNPLTIILKKSIKKCCLRIFDNKVPMMLAHAHCGEAAECANVPCGDEVDALYLIYNIDT